MPDGSRVAGPVGGRTARDASTALFNAPNIITFMRLCAVPLAFWLVLEHNFHWAFALFVAAGLSDAVDGWLARRYGGNLVGALLDPVADKALLVTMYVTLAATGVLPTWLAILVVFRDIVIVGGVLVLAFLRLPLVIKPLYVSKVNTVLQIVLVAATLSRAGFIISDPTLIGGWGEGGLLDIANLALIGVVAITTLASGAAYVWVTVRRPAARRG